jgi:hypothetical protein
VEEGAHAGKNTVARFLNSRHDSQYQSANKVHLRCASSGKGCVTSRVSRDEISSRENVTKTQV